MTISRILVTEENTINVINKKTNKIKTYIAHSKEYGYFLERTHEETTDNKTKIWGTIKQMDEKLAKRLGKMLKKHFSDAEPVHNAIKAIQSNKNNAYKAVIGTNEKVPWNGTETELCDFLEQTAQTTLANLPKKEQEPKVIWKMNTLVLTDVKIIPDNKHAQLARVSISINKHRPTAKNAYLSIPRNRLQYGNHSEIELERNETYHVYGYDHNGQRFSESITGTLIGSYQEN